MIRKMRGKGGWLLTSWGPWGPVVNNPHLFQVTDMGLAKITTSCDLKILRDWSLRLPQTFSMHISPLKTAQNDKLSIQHGNL